MNISLRKDSCFVFRAVYIALWPVPR